MIDRPSQRRLATSRRASGRRLLALLAHLPLCAVACAPVTLRYGDFDRPVVLGDRLHIGGPKLIEVRRAGPNYLASADDAVGTATSSVTTTTISTQKSDAVAKAERLLRGAQDRAIREAVLRPGNGILYVGIAAVALTSVGVEGEVVRVKPRDALPTATPAAPPEAR